MIYKPVNQIDPTCIARERSNTDAKICYLCQLWSVVQWYSSWI